MWWDIFRWLLVQDASYSSRSSIFNVFLLFLKVNKTCAVLTDIYTLLEIYAGNPWGLKSSLYINHECLAKKLEENFYPINSELTKSLEIV